MKTHTRPQPWVLPLAVFLAILCFFTEEACAGVNEKNGNFYIQYTDMIVGSGEHPLKIVRTYNSKAVEKGLFGYGWGSHFETILRMGDPKTPLIMEGGAGSESLFRHSQPGHIRPEIDETHMLKRLALAGYQWSDIPGQSVVERVRSDAELRHAFRRRFSDLIPPPAFPERWLPLFEVSLRGYELLPTDLGWERSGDSSMQGRTEWFDSDGQLAGQAYDGYSLTILRDRRGYLGGLRDSLGREIQIECDSRGHIQKLESYFETEGDSATFYRYNGDDLVESWDLSGMHFRYSYDDSHNMTQISYQDGTSLRIAYNDDQCVSRIVSRKGKVTSYQYMDFPDDPGNHYGTTRQIWQPGCATVTISTEYRLTTLPDGSNAMTWIRQTIDGVLIEFVRGESGLFTRATRASDTWSLDIDRHLVVGLHSPGLTVERHFNEAGRIDRILEKPFAKPVRRYSFEYDPDGVLTAVRSEDEGMILISREDDAVRGLATAPSAIPASPGSEAFKTLEERLAVALRFHDTHLKNGEDGARLVTSAKTCFCDHCSTGNFAHFFPELGLDIVDSMPE